MTISPTPKDVADMITMSEDMAKVDARMATSHTPGPWTLIEHARNFTLLHEDGTEDGVMVAGIEHVKPADRQLMKAAPEMLEALRRVERLLQIMTDEGLLDALAIHVHPDEINAACDVVDTAIAKATLP